MDTITYTIPGNHIEEARHRITKANNKLTRAGITEQFTWTEKFTPRAVDGQEYEFYELELSVPSISYQGWTFAAAVDILDNGTVLRSPSNVNADDLPRPTSHHCDHCGVSRGRKYSYLLLNEETGEIKQIGKSCLKLFLGLSPSGLWTLQWDDLDDLAVDDNDTASWSGIPVVFPADTVIRYAMALSNNGEKFISKTKAEMYGTDSTSQMVAEMLNQNTRRYVDKFTLDNAERLAGNVSDELVAEVKSSVSDVTGNYGENLRAIIGEKSITFKHLGLLCSAVSVYHRSKVEEQKKKEKAETPQEFLGDIKEKLVDVPVTVINKQVFSGHWDSQTMLIMRAHTGHILKWTSSSAPTMVGDTKVEIGAKLMMSVGTVKKHTIYDGVHQTDVIRVKFQEDMTTEPVQ